MLYCPNCQRLSADSPCAACNHRKLRAPEADDPVLLAEEGYIRAGMLEPLLEQAEIPFSKIGAMGSGIAAMVGYTVDSYRFYVPYAALEPARDVLRVLTGAGDVCFDGDTLAEEASLEGGSDDVPEEQ